MKTVTMRTLDDLDVVAREVRECFDKNGSVEVTFCPADKPKKGRTWKQNKSLHLYCTTIAEKMNAAGITQRELVGKFRDGFELPVEMHMVKAIFREVGKALYQKESTADLETVEMIKVYEVVDQRFGEIVGIRAEWPSMDSLMGERVEP
ncbi:MAG TPA: hypothetical protein DCS09_05845 [Porphyromonadaceae bacterium]|nr:hypothetical protein [Porphyromonadaceae bacterium]